MSASAPPPGTTLAPSPPPSSTNSTVSPSPLIAPAPPATNPSSPPPNTTSPPPPTVSAPPPTTPSPSPPSPQIPSPPPTKTPSASPPPRPTPSLPPTTTPSAPPPPSRTPSPPLTTTPSAPPPPSRTPSPPLTTTPPTALPARPPPQTPATSSPPPPVATSPPTIASPPPRTTPSTLSPPPRRLTPPPASSTTPSTPSGQSPFPPTNRNPPAAGKSSSGVSAGLVAGIAVSAVAIMVALILLFLYFRKKRRRGDEVGYNAPSSGPKDGAYGGEQQQQPWQKHNAPPLGASLKPLPSPPAFTSSSTGSTSIYTASSFPPPSRGLVLGLSTNDFTYEELAKATNGFSDANLLGQGGFGYVHKGVLPNGKEVAVKQLKAGSGQGEREFQAEVEIISRVHHRHLVSLVGYCITGMQRMLVYEFVPNNNLQFHLHGEGRPTMEWSNRLKIAIGAARGLAYLHEDCQPKIIHRDIKAANILLDFKFEAKVADFGLAKLTSDTDTHVSTRVMGTFGYLAPEYAQSGKLTDKSDVFSFGVVLLELMTGRKPVDTSNTYMDESLVDWARPLLTRATEDQNFEALADPRLNNEYDREEMASMVVCAAACVRHSAQRRPRMSQVVRALEGEMSLKNLNEGMMRPGHSSGSTDYDTMKYNEDLKRFRRMAFGGGATSEYSGQSSSEYFGTNPSGSSSEQTTRELEKAKMKGSSQGFHGGPALDE